MEKDMSTYVQILLNSLEKKEVILKSILGVTREQERLLTSSAFETKEFEELLETKDGLIEELNQLDVGFEQVYDRIKGSLAADKEVYREQIINMQHRIAGLTELSIQLRVMESRTRDKLELYIREQRRQIKQGKVSSRTAASYYKNMADQHQGQSYFLDKKK